MKNLSDFKKRIKKGVKLETLWFNPRTNQWEDRGVRVVNHVQTNAFTILTEKIKDGKIDMVDSWAYFPKAKDIEIVSDNEVHIFWEDGKPSLQYKFV